MFKARLHEVVTAVGPQMEGMKVERDGLRHELEQR